MNKEELIKAVNEGAMFTEEGDRVLYEQQVIDLIEQSLSGHVIVPEEPTGCMLSDGLNSFSLWDKSPFEAMSEAYKAMLSAAKGE